MNGEPYIYEWVEQTMTLDAIDPAVRAIDENPGWRLLGVGMGSGGQTTLTYGWPWPGSRAPETKPEPEPIDEDPPRVVDLMQALEASLAAVKDGRKGGAA